MRERRHFRTDWCYHLISRIAHRAFFLTEDERTRFVDLLRRYDLIGAVVSQGKWLGATGVFLQTGDGRRHRLAGDVDERAGARIVGWLKDKLCGDGRA